MKVSIVLLLVLALAPPFAIAAKAPNPYAAVYDEISKKTLVDCPSDATVLLGLGQSNAANRSGPGEEPLPPVPGVFNFFAGKCYVAEGPMLGAEGGGNSIWLPVAQKMVAAGLATSIIIATPALGSTSVGDWAPKGRAHFRLRNMLKSMHDSGLHANYITWFQGESDSVYKTPRLKYEREFTSLVRSIRNQGESAPIILSVTSVCDKDRSSKVRAAQMRMPDLLEDVYLGPDTDKFGRSTRLKSDHCHFRETAKDNLARQWFDSIAAVAVARRISPLTKPRPLP